MEELTLRKILRQLKQLQVKGKSLPYIPVAPDLRTSEWEEHSVSTWDLHIISGDPLPWY